MTRRATFCRTHPQQKQRGPPRRTSQTCRLERDILICIAAGMTLLGRIKWQSTSQDDNSCPRSAARLSRGHLPRKRNSGRCRWSGFSGTPRTVACAAADRPEQAGKPRSQDNRWGRLEGVKLPGWVLQRHTLQPENQPPRWRDPPTTDRMPKTHGARFFRRRSVPPCSDSIV